MLQSPLEENLDCEEGLAQDLLIHMKEKTAESDQMQKQLEMCGRQGKVLVCPVNKERGELSHSVRDQAKKGKTEPWTWNYARDFIYGGSGHRYKLIQPEVAALSSR